MKEEVVDWRRNDPLAEELAIPGKMTIFLAADVPAHSGEPSLTSSQPQLVLTSYPRRMPFMSCCTGSQLTFISEDEDPLAQTLAGATLGSGNQYRMGILPKTPQCPTELP